MSQELTPIPINFSGLWVQTVEHLQINALESFISGGNSEEARQEAIKQADEIFHELFQRIDKAHDGEFYNAKLRRIIQPKAPQPSNITVPTRP